MYKVLIADDEHLIRQGIASFVARDAGLQLVAQAEDGEIALQMAEAHQPDILLVDINMPIVSGLEFIERIASCLPDAVVIVISGYNDFAFVQKAFKLGVFDYLIKPVLEQPFFECIERAKKRIVQNRNQKKYLAWAKEQVEQNKPVVIATFLEAWLNGRLSEPEVLEQLRYLNLPLKLPLGITAVHIMPKKKAIRPDDVWSEDMLYYATQNIATEVFDALTPVTTYQNAGDDFILLSGCEPETAFQEAGRALKAAAEENLPVVISFVQAAAQTIPDTPDKYADMMEQLQAQSAYSQLITSTVQLIEAEFHDQAFSLLTAATALHVSSQHLSRAFRHETGMTFVDYLTKVRIRKAMELLSTGRLRMYDIADRVGYASQHYFSSAFKKVLGVSPLEYRKGWNQTLK